MGFWNRNSDDPLLQSLLKKYRLNLLSIPRDNAAVGDLYVQNPNSNFVSTPGSITNFLTPNMEIPENKIKKDEQLADVVGQISKDISGNAGLDFLEGFLGKLGSAGIGAKIRGAYEGSKNSKIMISFPDPKRDFIDPFVFGSLLMGHNFMKDHPLYSKDRRYYVVTGLAKSKSLSVDLQGGEKQSVDVNTNIAQIGNITGNLKIDNNQTGKLTYNGVKDLVFGVELYELEYLDEEQKFNMFPSKDAKLMRGAVGERAYIGDPVNGDAFISIKS